MTTIADDPFDEAAMQLAGAFQSFAEWIGDCVINRSLDAVFFLSREGPFLRSVVEASGVGHAVGPVLEVSRVSTFLASVEDFDLPTLMRLWERFPRQSPNAFLASLSFEPEQHREVLQRHELKGDEQIHRPWEDQRILSLIGDDQFLESALASRDEARRLLLRYLEAMGFAGRDSVALVDVGWRGTIQDSLAALHPSIETTGLLLAHRPADLPQPVNTVKLGYLAGRTDDGTLFGQELRLAASPLEMLTTGVGGSAIAYREVAGTVGPILRPIEHEEQFLRREIARFQATVIETIASGRARPATPANASEARIDAMVAFKNVLFDPASELVAVFERYQLDPSFGGASPPRRDDAVSIKRLASADGRRELRDALQAHGWPHALIKRRLGPLYRPLRRVAGRSGRIGRWLA